jgi:hypothetical protein
METERGRDLREEMEWEGVEGKKGRKGGRGVIKGAFLEVVVGDVPTGPRRTEKKRTETSHPGTRSLPPWAPNPL